MGSRVAVPRSPGQSISAALGREFGSPWSERLQAPGGGGRPATSGGLCLPALMETRAQSCQWPREPGGGTQFGDTIVGVQEWKGGPWAPTGGGLARGAVQKAGARSARRFVRFVCGCV